MTPYEWFSAADGRDWCVPFEQDAGNTDQQRAWALTGEEQAFVLSNFELFAAHFKAAQPRLVRQNAVTEDEDFDDDEVDDGTHWVDVVASELRSLYANGVDEGIVTRLHAAIALARYNDGEPIGDRQVEAPMLQAASIAAAHASNKRRRVD